MKQERYKYNKKCEKCSHKFKSDKSSTMFCSPKCQEEYFEEYSSKNKKTKNNETIHNNKSSI
jgi:endogenous inhibitor of DNA gyrase (YacG/DUF329 family)